MADEQAPEGTVVAATGESSPRGPGARANLVEQAMSAAVEQAQAEAKAIWDEGGTENMTDEVVAEKQRRINEIMNPDALRERKLAARREATGRDRDMSAEQSAAASEQK